MRPARHLCRTQNTKPHLRDCPAQFGTCGHPIKKWSPEKLCDYERLDRTVCKKNDIYELREQCRDNCPTHCLRQFVEFNVKKETKIHSLSHWNPKTSIFVTHSRLPDQRIDHLPEMTFVSYIANFGGLAGMWLGLSALAIYDFIFTFV